MASLQQEPTGVFHIVIRIDGKRYKRSLCTKCETKAIVQRDEITELFDLVKRGVVPAPQHVPLVDFLLSGGKLDVQTEEPVTATGTVPEPAKPKRKSKHKRKRKSKNKTKRLKLSKLFDQFFDAIPAGNIEDDTIRMLHIHERHLQRILKPGFDITTLTGQILQSYINKRANETTQYVLDKSDPGSSRKPVSATTIRKEISTLGSLWRWAAQSP